jgi:hypothetical protein
MSIARAVLIAPPKPNHLPMDVQWLSGEGCGSWFHILKQEFGGYVISRYSPKGDLECRGLFRQLVGPLLNLKKEYTFTYVSHCASVNILQDNAVFTFKLIEKW